MEGVRARRLFVGRGEELARLRAGLAEARAGAGRAIVLAGEAGIGKTRLLERFTDEARAEGVLVLDGTCLPGTAGGLAYAAVVEILRDLVRDVPPTRLPAVLGPGASDLGRLLPELVPDDPGTVPSGPPARQAQSLLFERLLGVFERATEGGPAIVAIENAHWADTGTRDLVRYLVHGLRDDPVLTVITARTDDRADGETRSFLAELQRAGAERIDLVRFDESEVADLVGGLTGRRPDRGVVERLVDRTDGNPFFIEELVRSGADAEGLPSVLRDVLGARIEGLSPRAREIVRVAAAAGRRIDDGLLAGALGTSPRELAPSLHEATDAGILEQTPDGYAFRHALLQEAVDAELFPGERTEIHRSLAEALEGRAAEHPGLVHPGEIARHWDLAGRPDRALPPLLDAAAEAEGVFAFADALRLWERARALHPLAVREGVVPSLDEPAILEHAAECAILAGEYDRAVAWIRSAIELVEPTGDRERSLHLLERQRWFLWEAGDREAAAAALAEALDRIPASPPSAARSRALGQLAGIELSSGAYEAAVIHSTEALALAGAVGSPSDAAFALGVLGWSQAVLGDVEGGLRRFEEGRALAAALGSVEGMALAASNLVSLLDRIGRPVECLEAARRGWEEAVRLGVRRTYGALLLGFAAKSELALGRLDDAERTCQEGLRLRPTGRAAVQLLATRGQLLASRGRFEEARAVLAEGREVDAAEGGTDFRFPAITVEAELAMWSGHPEEVRTIVLETLERAAVVRPPDPGLAWLAAMGMRVEADAAILARASRDEAALATAMARAERIEAALHQAMAGMRELPPSEGPRGAALMALFAVERERLDGSADPDAWRRVASLWEAALRPLPAAYSHFRAAEAILETRGPRETAAAELREALGTAHRLGAEPLAVLVRQLARHARIELEPTSGVDGGGDGRNGHDGADGPLAGYRLTDREAEVLALVAAGWTNQQIADALFITRKTASVHVSNILGKLGVERRVEAALVGARLGLGREAPPSDGAD